MACFHVILRNMLCLHVSSGLYQVSVVFPYMFLLVHIRKPLGFFVEYQTFVDHVMMSISHKLIREYDRYFIGHVRNYSSFYISI